MKPSSTQMTRDWLTQYTDLEIMVVQKIFENKTNFIIGHELDLSPKSINIRILGIFKKMGIRTGLGSKNLILHHFGVRHFDLLDKVKSFVMPDPLPKVPAYVQRKKEEQSASVSKIEFILEHGGYGIYDKKKIPYTREQLMSMNFSFLNKIYDRTCREVGEKLIDAMNLEEMTQKFPPLPFGFRQGNGISYQEIKSSNKKRILLLFPASKHKYIKNEEGKTE